MNKNNFVILAHARSGSTTLFHMFENQGIKIFCEPFNKDSIMKYLIHWGRNDFYSAIEMILNEYKGFKHLYSFATIDQNEFIKEKCNTIFLYREDLISAAVSLTLAFKTNVWLTNQKNENYYKEKFYINPEEVQSAVNHLSRHMKLKDDNCYVITYEDLYYSDKDKQKKIVKEMFDFVGCKIENYDKIERLLDVKNKINPENWSDIISNWEEIKNKVIC